MWSQSRIPGQKNLNLNNGEANPHSQKSGAFQKVSVLFRSNLAHRQICHEQNAAVALIVMLWNKHDVRVLECTEASGVVMTLMSLRLGFQNAKRCERHEQLHRACVRSRFGLTTCDVMKET